MAADSKDPDWKLTQKVAALLEKALSPLARVDHDVWLEEVTTGTK